MVKTSIFSLKQALYGTLLALSISGCSTLDKSFDGALDGAFEPIDLGAKLGRDNRIEVGAMPIALLASDPTAERVGKLVYRGGLYLNSRDKRFGAFSDLIVSEDGASLLAVSEGGYWFTATLVTKDGRLTDLRHASLAPMLNSEGKPLERRGGVAKAVAAAGPEGLKGGLYVAYERKHRVWLYPFGKDGFAARPQAIDIPADAQRLTATGGVQGLLTLDPGTLYAQSEDARDMKYDLQGWLFPPSKEATKGAHGVVFLKASGSFKPTSLAALPGGDVFVLERSFSPTEGAAMQIRRIKRRDIAPLAVLDGEVIAKLDVRYSIDNMEGLALRQGAAGETLLYILSNDNNNGLQRTVLLEFVLTDGAPKAAPR
jgi:hypothetical protein